MCLKLFSWSPHLKKKMERPEMRNPSFKEIEIFEIKRANGHITLLA